METHESINPEWSKYNSDSKRIMAVGSKSFFAASRLFPKRLSNPATIIYAYCRLADDLVDYGGGEEAVRELNHRLDAIAFRSVGTELGKSLLNNYHAHVIGRLKISEWNGRESLQMHIEDVIEL